MVEVRDLLKFQDLVVMTREEVVKKLLAEFQT